MEARDSVQNPYASPETSGEARSPEWYVSSACGYLKLMGWMVIVYVAWVVPVALVQAVVNRPSLGDVVGTAIVVTAFILFSGWMIRTASQLPTNFERLYKRARWQGILAGIFGFPILTIPAFLAVSRLSKYRTMLVQNGKDAPLPSSQGTEQ